MAYAYPAMVAWDPGSKSAVKNSTFQVYAVGDTSFQTPLAITDNGGNTLANLNSSSQGVFPSFQQAQYQTVVVSDVPNHVYAWTVSCSQANPVTPWTASTYYKAGQPIVDPAGNLVTANVNHTSGTSYTAANWTRNAVNKGDLTIDARDYGVVADGTTDDTAAWNSAINAASNATPFGGTDILAPAGTSVVSGLTLPTMVGIQGHGRRSRLKLKSASNKPVIALSSATTQAVRVSAITIDGNKANQTGGVSHGIYLINQTATISPGFEQYQGDAYHIVDNVFIINCDGDGVHTSGRGETNINDVKAMLCNGDGFRIDSFDTWVTGCSAGQAGNYGFNITQPHVALTSCKAFMNTLDGLFISGVTGATATDFVAQGNYRHGIQLSSSTGSYVQGVSFDNNYGQTAGSTSCGVYIANNAKRNHVSVQCYTAETPARQAAALYITSGCERNIIDVTVDTTMPLYLSGSTLRSNTVRVNGSSYGLAVDAFTATYAPDISTGDVRQVTLTGAITINRPTGTFVEGQTLTFIFIQDATGGRGVTWGSGFIQKSWQPAQAANALSVVVWRYANGNWNLQGGNYPQAAAPVVNQTAVSATYGTNEQTVLQSVQSGLTTVVAALKANGLLS